jgi:hypothetical protein
VSPVAGDIFSGVARLVDQGRGVEWALKMVMAYTDGPPTVRVDQYSVVEQRHRYLPPRRQVVHVQALVHIHVQRDRRRRVTEVLANCFDLAGTGDLEAGE